MGKERALSLRKRNLSYEKKKSLYGYGFIALWLIGFIAFFIRPMIKVVAFSVSNIEFIDNGYKLSLCGSKYFKMAFTEDADFLKELSFSFQLILRNVPIIIVVSLIIAILLNYDFKGRTFYRSVFFIPVIIASGIVISILKGDVLSQSLLSGEGNSSIFKVVGFETLLAQADVPEKIIQSLTTVSENVFDLLWQSGIQILIFIAALQTIPSYVYEASSIEGATSWDNFWKITIPMVSPMILLTTVYTIVDTFTDYNNAVMRKIITLANQLNTGYSSALSLIYFACILLFIGIVYKLISRFVFYSVE